VSFPETWAMHARNYKKGAWEDPRFFRRLGGAPDFRGKRVLDLGCGLGSLCTHVAEQGAASVVGVDLDADNLAFARHRIDTEQPDIAPRVQFLCQDVRALDAAPFDFIVTKDALEHVIELPSVMDALVRLLKPGGRLYIALGPLYHSALGDHWRLRLKVPWLHALLPERLALALLNLRTGGGVRSVHELGLNKWTVQQFRELLRSPRLKVVFYRENQTERAVAKVIEPLRKIPFLARYLTWNIYCILETPAA
jgi:SAM-dependent methyltransferase